MLAAQPVVAITGPNEATLGSTTTLTLTFDNQPDSSPGGTVGFFPYIDLFLPRNGADGAGPGSDPPFENDGITFVGASYLGAPVAATVLEFDVNGEAIHPFARDASGELRVVRAADYGLGAGDELVVLRLPFGSFTPDQTPAAISVRLATSSFADAGVPLPISAVGGFAFGRDALNNPTADPPVLGPVVSTTITPTVLALTKSFSGPEGETATGPNFPRFYTLSLDIAAGQTLSDLVLTDRLPDGIVVTGTTITSGPAGVIDFNPLTNDLTITFTSPVIGVAGPDVTVRVDFHVGEFLGPGAPGTPVLDPATGALRPMENNLAATATWTPLDPRDPPTTITVDRPGPENVFLAKPLAIQKSGTVIGGGAPEPFDTIRWTLSAQLSDYFSAAGLVLTDTLSDGQRIDPASPVLTVREGGAVIYAGAFDPANVSIVVNPDGTTTTLFRVADELAFRGLDPTLSGGRVGPPAGPTTVTVTFESEVQRFYADGRPLLQGDGLGNAIVAGATVPGTGAAIGDDSAAGASLERGRLFSKSIYLINGETPTGPNPAVTNGDTITFRLRYLLPTGSVNSFTLTDFLPLPVLTAGPLTFLDIRNDGTDPSTIPAPGSAWWHPDDTFDLANPTGYAGAPAVILDAGSNSVTFDFGSFFMPVPQPLTVDLLFRLPVEDRPFGDGLLLTNLVTAREANSAGAVTTASAITQFVLTQPQLNVTKGVVGVETGQTTFPVAFDPATVGPVAFRPPGTAGAPFTGTITSAALAAQPVDSNLAGVDAGDLVRFAIVVENTGSGIRGAFDVLIRDTLPAGFEVPPGGLTLTVTRGDGVAIPFALEGGGLFDPAGGLRLIDPGPLEGALARAGTTGSNLALIVYDLRVADATQANGFAMTNEAEIAFYAAQEGGADFAVNLLPQDRFDEATVTTGDPIIDKVLVSTSLPESIDPFVFIGEEMVFRVTLTLREGLTRSLVLADILPTTPGILTLRDWTLTSVGANLSFTGTAPPIGVPQTGPITIAFGDTLNAADNVVDARDQVVLTVRAAVLDLPQNNRGDVLVNRATATFTDGAGLLRTLTDTESVTIAEPALDITKTANRTTGDGGDLVTYTLAVRNPTAGGANAPVFDLNIRDIFNDPDLRLVAGSVALSGTAAGRASILLGNGPTDVSIRVFIAEFRPNETLNITYQARISDTVETGRSVINTAIAQGDSAPGNPPGQRAYEDLSTATVRIAAPTLAKVVLSTSLPETTASQGNPSLQDLAFGEEVTFRLTARFPEGTTPNVTLRDLLPINLTLEARSATIVSVGSNITAPGAIVGASAVFSDRNANGFNDTATFAIGTVFNRPDGVSNANDTIVIDVTARLRGDLGAPAGVVMVNRGELLYTSEGAPRTVAAQVSVESVLPRLSIDKVADQLTADGGDVITYTVTLRNLAGSFAGPAFDILLTDLLEDPDLTLVPGSVTVSGVPATILSGNAPGDTEIRISAAHALIGETLTVRYQAKIADAVIAGTTVDNIARYAADTHPGVRPGEVTLRGADNEVVRIGVPALSKEVFATSLPETGRNQFNPSLEDVAIGETVVFRIVITLPEGTNILLKLDDQLPTGPGVMQYLSYAIPPLPPTTNLSFVVGTESPTVTDSNGDGIPDRLRLEFGTVTNTPDGVVDENDQIVVLVTARVIDAPGNIDGRVLTNTAQTRLDTVPQEPATASVEVVEPRLLISKSAGSGSGDAGDIVTFRITVAPAPSMTGPAFNARVTDLIPADMTLVAGSVRTSAGTILLGNGAGDDTVEVLLPTLLPGAAAVTITYSVRLNDTVEPQQVIDNRADAPYASAPSFQRSYAVFDTARVTVAMDPQVAKNVVVTSLPETSFQFFDPDAPDVAIGEVITYQIIATLREGTQTLVLRDLLPAGGNLRVIDSRVDSIGANISGSALAVGDPGVVTASGVTFDFGTVVNAGDNRTDGRDQVAVVIRARVADVPANVAGVQLRNDGEVAVGAPSDPGVRIVRTDPAFVDVVEPRLRIFKDAPVTTGDAGDEITFTVVVVNVPGATAPAYALRLTDLLAPGMTLVAGSVTTDRGAVVTGNAPGDREIRVELDNAPLLPITNPLTPFDDTRVTITYRVRLDDTVEPGQTLVNTARFEADSARLPLAGEDIRVTAGEAAATVTVVMPVALEKRIIATSPALGSGQFDPDNPDLAIGGTVTYRLTATLSEGTQRFVIADTLPAGLVFEEGRVVAVGTGLPPGLAATAPTVAGQAVTFDFGVVVNAGNNDPGDGTVAVEIVARVADVPGNVAGAVLVNAGSVIVSSPTDPSRPGGTETASAATAADVVEPALVLEKAAPAGFARPGETVPYTITLGHAPGSTAPAYDLVITDLLTDPNLILVAGSVATSRGAVTSGNGAGDTSVTVTLESLGLGETVTITFVVEILAAAPGGATAENTASVAFDTSPGPGGRPGTAEDTAALPLAPGFAKVIADTSIAETTGTEVAIGERITYALTATLPRGPVASLVLADLLPAGLVPVEATVVSIGSGIAGSALAPGAPGTITGQEVRFDFGDVTNLSGPAIGDEDVIVVRIVAEVADVAGNVAGRLLPNDARLTFAIGGEAGEEQDSVVVTIVEPVVGITKGVDRLVGDAGDLFTYTLTIANAPGASGPAYAVVVVDDLPAPLVVEPGSLVASLGTATIAGNAIRVEIPVLLPTDPAVTVTFQARFDDSIEPGQVVTNTATVSFASAPGPGSRPGSASDSATVTGRFTVALEKEIIDTSLPGTGRDFFDPDRPDVAIGEVITYRIVATLSEGTQRVLITDLLPPGLVPETAVIDAVGAGLPPGLAGTAGVIAGQVVTFDLGTVVNIGNNDPGDDTITILVTARVADVPTNQSGTLLANGATITVSPPSGGPGGPITAGASAGADVVVPSLVVGKAADRAFAVVGEVVTYTLTLAHAAGSTAPAYSVVLADTLAGTALRLVPGSVTTTFGVIESGNGGGDTAVRVTVPELPIGQTITVTFQAVPVAVPPPAGLAPNTADFAAASAPDGPPGFVRPFAGSDTAVILLGGGFVDDGPFDGLDALDRFLAEQAAFRMPVTAAPPVYSGTATPGAAVTFVLRDATGAIAGFETRYADLGGNWLVAIQGMEQAPPPKPNTETLRAEMRVAGGRILNVNADLASVSRPEPSPAQATAGVALTVTPQQGLATLLAAGAGAADGMRVYFAGANGASSFATGVVDALGEATEGGLAGIRPDQPGVTRPFGLALNKFAMDFLAGSTVPSGRLN